MSDIRFLRQWHQHYDDNGEPLDEWYEVMTASVRHGGREYGLAVEIERYEANPDEWEQLARRVLQMAIDADEVRT